MDANITFCGKQWHVWLYDEEDGYRLQVRYAPVINGLITGMGGKVCCYRFGNTISPNHTEPDAYELFKFVSALGTDEVHDACGQIVEYWDRQKHKQL